MCVLGQGGESFYLKLNPQLLHLLSLIRKIISLNAEEIINRQGWGAGMSLPSQPDF